MVNKSIDLLEWSLDIRFPSEQKSKIKQILINAWRTNNRAQIESTLGAVDIQNKLSQMNETDRNNLRENLKTAILENLQKEPKDELSQVTLEAYEVSRSTSPKTPPNKQAQINSTQKSNNSELWTLSKSASLTNEQAKAILQQAAPANIVVEDIKSLSFEEAIVSARKFLNERASREALAAFNASPQARDAKRANVAAGGAMIANKPLAALAALLRAHELQPQNATYLTNLAAVLSYIGMPHEALAILDSPIVKNGQIASPLGMGGQAGALNTRGHALLQLGRTKEAEDALRKAITQSPNLSEAKTNLAFALWMQDDPEKKEEGGRLIAAVWRRTPPPNAKTSSGKKTPPSEPEKPGSEEIPSEIFESEKTGTANLDLSRGKRLKLPDLKIPATLEASVAMHPKYEGLMQQIKAIQAALTERQSQLEDKNQSQLAKELEKAANSSNPVSAVNAVTARSERLEAVKELIDFEKVKQHPAVRSFWEKAQLAFLYDYQGVNFLIRASDYQKIPAGVADRGGQSQQLRKKIEKLDEAWKSEQPKEGWSQKNEHIWKALEKKYNQLKCGATREAHAKWRTGLHDYDTAQRNFLQAAYKHMTGVIANIADPTEHEIAQLRVESHINTEWFNLVFHTDSFHSTAESAIKNYCGDPSNKTEGDDLDNMEAEKADRCPDALKGSNKAKVDFELVSVSFNCEVIGVEISSPWLGLFVEAEGTFKGGWISQYEGVAIGFGVKGEVEIPGLPEGVEGKAGGYVKLDKDGNFKDAGFKTGTTITKGIIGPVAVETGTDVELTILPALGLPLPEN